MDMRSTILDQLSVAAILILLTMPVTAGKRDPALAGFFAAPLVVENAEGIQHAFTAYLAMSPAQRAHGLMYVRSLPADYGMLFIHEKPGIVNMWMKNTVLSLDMLFIRANGTIANIAHDTVPGSLQTISSDQAVTGVLELNAGTARKLNIAAGDKVIYHAFSTQPNAAVSPASDPR